jgi:hypothetical protein
MMEVRAIAITRDFKHAQSLCEDESQSLEITISSVGA